MRWLLAVTVALVLADSAVVTLALPDIVEHLDASVTQVAWVLIAYNLVLGIAAVPAAATLRWTSPRHIGALGIAVFAGASAWCAVAGSIDELIVARCVQALGGALALVGCLELLVADGGERRGVGTWITAGVIGTAAGPFVGGLLTQAISWEAIFIAQVPFAALAVPAALWIRAEPATTHAGASRTTSGQLTDRHRPAVRPHLTLALLSAALTAALFLLVLLLVEGWRHSPATAALTVSVVPVAALGARPLARALRLSDDAEVAAGCVLIAGGLVGLALPPSAALGWTIAPQALIGLGLGLTVDRLTDRAIRDRLPRPRHAAWAIGSRHLGVVVGLAILTPIFTADLLDAERPAQEAIASLVIDAPLPPEEKVEVARRLGAQLVEVRGQVPELRLPDQPDLEVALNSQLDRAVSRAFRDSYLVGAGLAILALLVLVPLRRRALLAAALALALSGGVVGVQAAAGGGDFTPTLRADPCGERPVTSQAEGIDGLAELLVLRGLDGAACILGVTREAFVLEIGRDRELGVDQEQALREGLLAAVDTLAEDGDLPPVSALAEEALDQADLNRFLLAALRAIPDGVIDAALKTDDVLRRAIADLDLRALLGNLDDTSALNRQLEDAVTGAVREALIDRVRNLF
ncbi:MFS transporter [Nocardioides sp. R-C-SC26]|uniref:MFS transporter n=1 Tax=Nocardioides sp. R-C-SC26 TaxID=2870414 RepID=UPI001E5571C4|nr:MFS transporter [Nocardioides sp. R-C-SC26]